MVSRRCLSSWCRRWRNVTWCCLCLLSLGLLALKESLPNTFHLSVKSSQTCPPTSLEDDYCVSWRSLTVVHGVCACPRNLKVLHNDCTEHMLNSANSYLIQTQEMYGNSTCSTTATLRGPRQHVLSFSAPTLDEATAALINRTLKDVKNVYRGWIVRVYIGGPPARRNVACPLLCSHDNLDICDVRSIGEPIRNVPDREKLGWEFGVIGDPLVEAWETRSLGSALLPREKDAVTQFINSEQCWHLMRDHITQVSRIGSGTVGGKLSFGLKRAKALRQTLFSYYLLDQPPQEVIENEILSAIDSNIMFHDSVSCWPTEGTIPFPTQRQPGTWVGMPKYLIPETPHMYQNSDQYNHQNLDIFKKIKLSFLSVQHSFIKSTKKEKLDHSHVPESNLVADKNLDVKQSLNITKLNERRGINECPIRCRPLKHKEWNYC